MITDAQWKEAEQIFWKAAVDSNSYLVGMRAAINWALALSPPAQAYDPTTQPFDEPFRHVDAIEPPAIARTEDKPDA